MHDHLGLGNLELLLARLLLHRLKVLHLRDSEEEYTWQKQQVQCSETNSMWISFVTYMQGDTTRSGRLVARLGWDYLDLSNSPGSRTAAPASYC